MIDTTSAFLKPGPALVPAYVYKQMFDILPEVPVLLSMPNASMSTV